MLSVNLRAAILTGKYPESTGVYPGVFWADSVGGLPTRHKTLAERLSKVILSDQVSIFFMIWCILVLFNDPMFKLGYATAILGKWHLGVGVHGEYLPTRRGFDRDFVVVDSSKNLQGQSSISEE